MTASFTPEELKGYREQFDNGAACMHCGGLHLRACPRVKRIVFHRKDEISEVEYWPEWPDDHIIWPEDIYADEDEDEKPQEA